MSTQDAGVKKIDQEAPLDTEVEKDDSGASQDQEADAETLAKLLEDERKAHAKTAEERDNYKTGLTQKRQLVKKSKKEDDEEVDDDKPITGKALKSILSEIALSNATSKEESIMSDMVKSPDKRKLVEFYIESGRIGRTGNSNEEIRSYIQDAIDLADSKANRRKSEEIIRAKSNTNMSPSLSGSGSDRGAPAREHGLGEKETEYLKGKFRAAGIRDEETLNKLVKQTYINTKKRTGQV